MKIFLSCDWGTSSFRLNLVNIASASIIATDRTANGIASTYQLWTKSGADESTRAAFYLKSINASIKKLEKQTAQSLTGVPVVLSGMVSSSIGIKNLPYQTVPFLLNGSDLLAERWSPRPDFPHEVLIISGARTENDVMRGEETQIIGANLHSKEEHTLIMPGTHSKHVFIKNGQVIGFKTYMTGEFFALLSQRSTLSEAIATENTTEGNDYFEKGITDSLTANLLHRPFSIRANYLFGKTTKTMNFHYLSGLLIGTELRSLPAPSTTSMTLIADGDIGSHYRRGFEILGLTEVAVQSADQALIQGQKKLLQL